MHLKISVKELLKKKNLLFQESNDCLILQELYAAINGKAEESENLQRSLDTVKTELSTVQARVQEVETSLNQSEEENSRLKDQVIFLYIIKQGYALLSMHFLFTLL